MTILKTHNRKTKILIMLPIFIAKNKEKIRELYEIREIKE